MTVYSLQIKINFRKVFSKKIVDTFFGKYFEKLPIINKKSLILLKKIDSKNPFEHKYYNEWSIEYFLKFSNVSEIESIEFEYSLENINFEKINIALYYTLVDEWLDKNLDNLNFFKGNFLKKLYHDNDLEEFSKNNLYNCSDILFFEQYYGRKSYIFTFMKLLIIDNNYLLTTDHKFESFKITLKDPSQFLNFTRSKDFFEVMGLENIACTCEINKNTIIDIFKKSPDFYKDLNLCSHSFKLRTELKNFFEKYYPNNILDTDIYKSNTYNIRFSDFSIPKYMKDIGKNIGDDDIFIDDFSAGMEVYNLSFQNLNIEEKSLIFYTKRHKDLHYYFFISKNSDEYNLFGGDNADDLLFDLLDFDKINNNTIINFIDFKRKKNTYFFSERSNYNLDGKSSELYRLFYEN